MTQILAVLSEIHFHKLSSKSPLLRTHLLLSRIVWFVFKYLSTATLSFCCLFEHIFSFIMFADLLFAYDCISWLIFSFNIQELSCWCVVSSDCWLPLEVETVNLCVSRYSVSLDLFVAIILPLESLLKCSVNKLKLEGISFRWLWCITL